MDNMIVSSSPHVHSKTTISSIMGDVIIALMPALIAGVYFFGLRSALVVTTSVACAVLSELVFQIIANKKVTISDLSAVVTGMLLGLNLPPSIPLWMAAVGSVFSIVVVKQIFGGLGINFMNPALAGRCFMLIAWTGAMTTFAQPLASDAVSAATPLAAMKASVFENVTIYDAFIGKIPGCIGETSAIALIIGFAYLIVKKVVSVKIPLAYLLTFALMTFIFGNNTTEMAQWEYTVYQLLTGGLLLGAFFMATDYTTTPTTPKGMVVFGIGCGLLTFVIRQFGGYPEGVSFSIILMNIVAPLIENVTVPKTFGKGGKRA